MTAIPGPRSRELFERRNAAVPRGLGTTLPVFIERAGGGVLVDVDGNSLIDLGAGIAVVSVGNAADHVVRNVQEQVGRVHPHLLHGHALRRLRGGLRGAQPAHPRRPRQEVGAVQLRRRGRRERRQDRPRPHRARRRRRLRARLPRPHEPHDGDDREEHAVQARASGRSRREVYRMPLAYPFRWPTGPDDAVPRRCAQVISKIDKEIGADNVAAIVIEPIAGEGGFIVPAPGFLPGARRVRAGERHRVRRRRGADRLRPHRRAVRLRARGRRARPDHAPPRASPAACRWPP